MMFGYRTLIVLLLPVIVVVNLLWRLWDEVKGIPYMLWLEIRQDWDDFMSSWRTGRPF